MTKKNIRCFFLFCLALGGVWQAYAKGPSTTAGSSLLETPSARAAALGEAFSAVTNDVTAFAYNPATLRSLESKQTSLLFQKGIANDSYSQLIMGLPQEKRSWGASLGYFNGGELDLFDGVSTHRVTSKRDLNFSIGMAHQLNFFSLGYALKYFSSELGGVTSTQGLAADMGLQGALTHNINVGVALQNVGAKIKYQEDRLSLPTVIRTGATWRLHHEKLPTQLLIDLPYALEEKTLTPALGVESLVGPLALRLGYKTGRDLEGFSMGIGVALERTSFDYALGLVQDLNVRQKVSFSFRFGEPQEQKNRVIFPSRDEKYPPINIGRKSVLP